MRSPRVILGLLTLVVTVVAVPALAAPARTGTVSAAAPVFKWDGGPGNGAGQPGGTVPLGNARCSPGVYECEDTLLEIKDAGPLTIEIKAGSGSNDLDVRVYKSDETGSVPGNPALAGQPGQPAAQNPVAEDISENKDAKVTIKGIKPGFYVAQVAFFNATAGTYSGTATLAASAPAPVTTPVTAPTATPTPAAKPKPKASKRKACEKKAKKIKNKKKRAKALKKCKKIKN